jgi:hypothetical protein
VTILSSAYVNGAYAAAASVSYSPIQGNFVKISVGFTKLTGTPVPTVTDNLGTTYKVAQGYQQGSTSGNYLGSWYLSNVPAGITSFSVSFSGGTATPYMLAQEWSFMSLEKNGAVAAVLIGPSIAYRTAPGTGANAIASSSVNVTQFPSLLTSVVFDPAVANVTAGTGLTSRFSSSGDALSAGDARYTSIQNSQTALWTTTNGSDNFLVECTVFTEQVAIGTSWASAQISATSVTVPSHTPLVGGVAVSYCWTNHGPPVITDSLSGTWAPVVNLAGPTGGTRAYSLYRSWRAVTVGTAFSINWAQAGGVSGQIAACAMCMMGIGQVSPLDTAAIPAGALGSSASLLTNTSGTTTGPVEIAILMGSTDTTSTSSFTLGLIAGATGLACGMTDNASAAASIVAGFNVVSPGTYSGAATNTINAHWAAALDLFSATDINFPYSLACGTVTYAYSVENATFNWGPNVYTLLAAPVNYNYSVAQSAADYSLTAGPVVYNYSVQPASGGESGPGIGGTEAQTLLIGIRIGI